MQYRSLKDRRKVIRNSAELTTGCRKHGQPPDLATGQADENAEFVDNPGFVEAPLGSPKDDERDDVAAFDRQ
jgi:hypothetical protein